MGLATPVGIWSALAALAKRGIVPRDGDLVEKLSQIDTVVFDKTGTLGEEELELDRFRRGTRHRPPGTFVRCGAP
jgi:Cation transport ATPase